MATLTIKNIPDELYEKLKVAARANRRSINNEIIVIIEQAVSPQKMDVEEQLAQTRLLREQLPLYASDEQLHRTKNEGRSFGLVDYGLADLLQSQSELRWSMVLNAYLDEEINLGKAAELLELSELALRERFIESGVPLRLGSANFVEAMAETNAFRSWLVDK
jgi:plasmid stability protein/predicted HTH domain antitoxin